MRENDKHSFEETIAKRVELPVSKGPKRSFILFLKGPLLGKLYPLEKGASVLGRSNEADIVVDDQGVSRKHLKIKSKGENVIVKDIGSTNGTYVNSIRITEHALQNGDKIQISPSTIFKFVVSAESEKVFLDELYLMGVTDPVTNVYNKKYFIERLRQEFIHAKRTKAGLSLLMVDTDFFKKINDAYGPLAGDLVLIKISEILSGTTRNDDIVARYSEEEFGVILPGTDEEGASICAERIRSEIDKATFMFEDKELKITVSVGAVTLSDKHSFDSTDDFIKAAGDCLLYSKKHGRNLSTNISKIKG